MLAVWNIISVLDRLLRNPPKPLHRKIPAELATAISFLLLLKINTRYSLKCKYWKIAYGKMKRHRIKNSLIVSMDTRLLFGKKCILYTLYKNKHHFKYISEGRPCNFNHNNRIGTSKNVILI